MSYGDTAAINAALEGNKGYTPPPPSVTNPQRQNPWSLPPLPQRDTSQGDPLAGLTPEMQATMQGLPGYEAPIDYSSPLENRQIADENKGLFLGSAWFDRVQAGVANPEIARLGSDPYRYVNSGLNVQQRFGGPDGPVVGTNFNPSGRVAEKSPAADLYMLYQQGPADPNGKRAYLQKMLFSAGLVDRDNPVPAGDWGDPFDSDYQNAWRAVVHESMRTGVPVMVLLRDRAAYFENNGGLPGSGSGGGGGGGPRRPTAQIISEDDARALVDQVAQQQLGRNLSDEEEALARGIVDAVRDQMLSETNAIIDQQMAGGGSVSRPTDPSVSTREQLESRLEGESGAYDIAQAFANLIGLSTGGRA